MDRWWLWLGLAALLFKDKFVGVAAGTGTGPGCQGRVKVCGGVITGPRARYRLTMADKLWLGRAILGEVNEQHQAWARDPEVRRGGAAVAWAMAQNFMLIAGPRSEAFPRGKVPRFSRFVGVLRAYCQPINPKYASLGASGCRRHPASCTERHLARRRRFRTATWSSLPLELRELVERWAAGDVANPVVGMTDWHARTYRGARVEIAGNHFGVSEGRRLI